MADAGSAQSGGGVLAGGAGQALSLAFVQERDVDQRPETAEIGPQRRGIEGSGKVSPPGFDQDAARHLVCEIALKNGKIAGLRLRQWRQRRRQGTGRGRIRWW